MKLAKGTKATIFLGSICSLFLIFIIAFRAFIYADMYIVSGEPYGISDVIEIFLIQIFFVLLMLSVLLSIALLIFGTVQSKKAGIILIFFSVFLFFMHSPLRQLAAQHCNI